MENDPMESNPSRKANQKRSLPLACRLGMHAKEWRYISPGGCDRELVCRRCRKKFGQEKDAHDFTAWQVESQASEKYLSSDAPRPGMWARTQEVELTTTISSRTCRRCGFAERKEEQTTAVLSEGGTD